MQPIPRIRKAYVGTLATAVLLCLLPTASASSASSDEALVTIKGAVASTEGADARRPNKERYSGTPTAHPSQESRSSNKVGGQTSASPYRQGGQAAQTTADRHGLKRALVDGGTASESGERKQLSKEERRALQRELREAARGANESRPAAAPGLTN